MPRGITLPKYITSLYLWLFSEWDAKGRMGILFRFQNVGVNLVPWIIGSTEMEGVSGCRIPTHTGFTLG